MDNKELLERFVALAPQEWKVTMFEVAKPNAVLHSVRNAADDGVLYLDIDNDRESAETAFFLWDYLEGKGWMPSISSTEDGPTLEMVTTGEANEFEYVTWNLGHSKNRIEALVRACVAYWESTGNQEGE